MGAVWDGRLAQLVASHGFETRQLAQNAATARRNLESLAKQLEALEERAARSGESFKAQVEKLMSRRDDPEVWVRNYGAAVLAYHSVDKPCGWAKNLSRYKRMLLSEARDRGIGPCVSCGYLVSKKAA
jgi:hypothetical protein